MDDRYPCPDENRFARKTLVHLAGTPCSAPARRPVVMSATQKLLRFGAFELNLDTEELRKSGTVVKLPPQPLKLLALLASHSGQIVVREEIQKQLWGEETYVD